MKYLKVRKMEQPFYFTYEKVCEIMKEYLPNIESFASFIDEDLHDIHCDVTRCSVCPFQTKVVFNQACSFIKPTVVYNPVYECQLRGDEAEGLVKGLNKTREICSNYTNCDCFKCWLRDGPRSIYLCGGKENKL